MSELGRAVKRQRTWREQHPFLYGLSQTFGIFPVRQPIQTVGESLSAAFGDIEWAIAEAERRYGTAEPQEDT